MRLTAHIVRPRLAALVAAFVVLLTAAPAAHAAMTIDAGPRDRVSYGEVTIWWTSSSTASSELHYGTASGSWAALTNDVSNTATTLGTLHSRSIEHLGPGTYYYRVRSTGVAGVATSAVESFTVRTPNSNRPIGWYGFSTSPWIGNVSALAMRSDGSVTYMAGGPSGGERTGAYLQVDPTTAARIPGTPEIWGNAGSTGEVNEVISDGAGGWYVAGGIGRSGGWANRDVTHVLPDGGVDPFFDTATSAWVDSLALVGGKLYIGGQ
ncbi:MAG: hypothetical protein H7287_07250, partial [Thermoleophilia bacterium]|nr:hypothetical protein [Thermoleophilia bacterium]